jgi:hypothetical protein
MGGTATAHASSGLAAPTRASSVALWAIPVVRGSGSSAGKPGNATAASEPFGGKSVPALVFPQLPSDLLPA